MREKLKETYLVHLCIHAHPACFILLTLSEPFLHRHVKINILGGGAWLEADRDGCLLIQLQSTTAIQGNSEDQRHPRTPERTVPNHPACQNLVQKKERPVSVEETHRIHRRDSQDGAGGYTAAPRGGPSPPYTQTTVAGGEHSQPHLTGINSASTPSAVPSKSKLRLTQDTEQDTELSHASQPPLMCQPLNSSIAEYPTLNQPIMDTTLKDMLLTLQNSIHSEITKLVLNFSSEMSFLGERVTTIETNMGEVTSSFIDLVDAHN